MNPLYAALSRKLLQRATFALGTIILVAAYLPLGGGCPADEPTDLSNPIELQGDGLLVDDADPTGGEISGELTALDYETATIQNQPVSISVTARSVSDLIQAFSVVTEPAQGSISSASSVGENAVEVTYLPPPDYVGHAQFSYDISVGDVRSNVATVSINVYPEVRFNVEILAEQPQPVVLAHAFTRTGEELPEGTYAWHFDDQQESGPVSTHAVREYVFAHGGSHVITLTLTLAGLTAPIGCSTGDTGADKDFEFTTSGQAGVLQVAPTNGLNSSGNQGGPFDPDSKTYTLSNTGGEPINWSASRTQNWINLSQTNGTLAPGGSTAVIVSINDNANSLPARPEQPYTDTLTFANITNGSGNAVRPVSLTVNSVPDDPDPGFLQVTPTGGLISAGVQGGPFNPENETYTLTNTGDEPLDWAASKTQNWVSLSNIGGTLAPDASVEVIVSINANANGLPAAPDDPYSDTVAFTNTTNGEGNTTRAVNLTVNLPPGNLDITPSNGLNSSGDQGGPFTPDSQVYTLTNTGGEPIDWTASKTQDWVSLSDPISGSLEPDQSATVTVSINANANSLDPGSYSDTVMFTNTTNGNGDTERIVALTVLCEGAQPMTTASRTSGVAPLGVFFDAIDTDDPPWTSGVVQPRGFEDHPTNITGVRITRVEYGTPLGLGTLNYTSVSTSLTWAANGELAGSAVDVSSGGNFAMESGGGLHLHVWVNPAELPGGNAGDAIQIVDGGLNADWNSFHYAWNFGDPGSGFWTTGATKSDGSYFSKNQAFGWNAAHVYEEPATYTVTLTITDDVDGTHVYAQDITIDAEPLGGWITYYFAESGDDITGDGSQNNPYRSFAKAMQLADNNVRLLFKREDEFPVTAMAAPSASGPLYVGAYDSGDRPRFTVAGTNHLVHGGSLEDARFVDLWVDGPYPTQDDPGDAFKCMGNNTVLLRCRVQDMGDAYFHYWRSSVITQDCEAADNKGYGCYSSGNSRIAFLGCTFADANTEWLFRSYGDKQVLSHSDFRRQMSTKGMARFMDDKWVISSFNNFSEAAGGQIFALEYQGDPVVHALILANEFDIDSGTSSMNAINVVSATSVAVLANRVYGTDHSGTVVSVSADPHSYLTSHNIIIANNTCYYGGDQWIRFATFSSSLAHVSNWRVYNNILLAPDAASQNTTKVIRLLGRSVADPVLESNNNCWRVPNVSNLFDALEGQITLAVWQGGGNDTMSITFEPLLASPATGDLTLQQNSPCIDIGENGVLPWCRIDAHGIARPIDADGDGLAVSDIGAYERRLLP